MVPQDIQTDRTVGVDIGVIDLGREADLWRLEGVIGGEGNGKEEDTTRMGRLALFTKQMSLLVPAVASGG